MALLSAIKGMIRWARTSKDGSDAGQIPVQQVEYLGKVGDAASWMPYGFHALAPAGELALVVSLQGNPESRVAIVGSPTSRPKLAAGEVVVYHPRTGTKIHLKNDGTVEVEASSVTITAESLTVDGDLTVTGDTALGAAVTSAGVNIGSTHVHGGVQTGGGTTGGPQ